MICSLQHFRHYLLGNKTILRTDHHSLKWLKTFKRPEGILARWVETLAEFDIEIEHRPGRLHSNVDGVSRPFCKLQCSHKTMKTPWVDELERADEITKPLGVHIISAPPEISNQEMVELQSEDPSLGPVTDWISTGHLPSHDELRAVPLETRNLWAQRQQVDLIDGLLVRPSTESHLTQLVLLQILRRRIFENVHAGPLSAHFGPDRTVQQLLQYYYWPGMRRDVDQWHQECVDCARSRGSPLVTKVSFKKCSPEHRWILLSLIHISEPTRPY